MRAVVDNDVLCKAAAYDLLDLLDLLLNAACPGEGAFGILGSARYVVPARIRHIGLRRNELVAMRAVAQFIERADELEPVEEEERMAADLELHAQKIGLSLDAGESQLCAVLVVRSLRLLVTGDKRAIAAIEVLIDVDSRLEFLRGRALCLEQVFLTALHQSPSTNLRAAVCTEPEVDKAMTICFSCYSDPGTAESPGDGLRSYIGDLRRVAGRVLAPDDYLSRT